jgi:hypothetical protein
MESKFHPALLEVWDCWKKDPGSCKLVQDGKIKIQIWLTHDTPETLAQLRALGFELSEQESGKNYVIGKLLASQLEALSQSSEVKFAGLARR